MGRGLQDIKRELRELPISQLRQLSVWLQEILYESTDNEPQAKNRTRQVLEQRQQDGKTYRLERVRCSKENCKCASGHLHGPYWYAYWTENGKTKSWYIGKELKY